MLPIEEVDARDEAALFGVHKSGGELRQIIFVGLQPKTFSHSICRSEPQTGARNCLGILRHGIVVIWIIH